MMLRAALLAAIIGMALAASSPSNHWIIDRPPYRTATSPKLAFSVPEMLAKVLIGNNISHSGSEIYMAESGSAFVRAPALSSMLRRAKPAISQPTMSQTIHRDGENPIVDALKRALIAFERVAVTITSGKELAQAQAIMEENRLFGARHLAKARTFVRDKLGFTDMDKDLATGSLRDCYSSGPFSELSSDPGHAVAIRKQHAARMAEPMQHELETASMMDCYSPYGQSVTDMELSGGYKEGDGDDLPILRHFDFEKRPEDQRYSESQLHSEYPDSAFRD